MRAGSRVLSAIRFALGGSTQEAQLVRLERELKAANRKLEHRALVIRDLKKSSTGSGREIDDLKRQIGTLEYLFAKALTDFRGFCLLPPAELRMHVGTTPTAAKFWHQGSSSSGRVLEVFGEDPSGPVLDWGCGTGRTINWLFGRGSWASNYRGCDVDGEAIQWLHANGIQSVMLCQPEPPLPYPDGYFEGLFTFSVLSHIHPKQHAAWYREIHRILRPGGIAYVTVQGESVILTRKSFTDEERQEYRRQGWCHSKRPGHYKDAAIVSEQFTREVLNDLFVVREYRAQGYSPTLDDMILEKRR